MKTDQAQEISSMVNSTLFNPVQVGEDLAKDHPYLQQEIFKMMLGFIEAQAGKQYHDGRNEYTVKLCKELHEVVKNFTY